MEEQSEKQTTEKSAQLGLSGLLCRAFQKTWTNALWKRGEKKAARFDKEFFQSLIEECGLKDTYIEEVRWDGGAMVRGWSFLTREEINKKRSDLERVARLTAVLYGVDNEDCGIEIDIHPESETYSSQKREA